MTITNMKDEGMWFIECDSCSHSAECSSSDMETFGEAWHHFKVICGWRAFKVGDDPWQHSCPLCVASYADKQARIADGRPAKQ